MEKRRALTATLPPDEQEFLVGSNKASKSASQQAIIDPEEAGATIPITVRFPPSIVQRLRTATVRRKNARRRPYTQQEILLQALTTWLDRDE